MSEFLAQEGDYWNSRKLVTDANENRLLAEAIQQTVAELEGLRFGRVELILIVKDGRLIRCELGRKQSFEASPGSQSGGGERKVVRRYKLRKTDQGNERNT